MSKDLNMSLLLDFYGDMLNDKQKEAMDLFYNSDMSLAEISEETGITRQGVRDRIVKGEKILSELENKLGLAKRFTDMKRTAEEAEGLIKKLGEENNCDVSKILELISKLAE